MKRVVRLSFGVASAKRESAHNRRGNPHRSVNRGRFMVSGVDTQRVCQRRADASAREDDAFFVQGEFRWGDPVAVGRGPGRRLGPVHVNDAYGSYFLSGTGAFSAPALPSEESRMLLKSPQSFLHLPVHSIREL